MISPSPSVLLSALHRKSPACHKHTTTYHLPLVPRLPSFFDYHQYNRILTFPPPSLHPILSLSRLAADASRQSFPFAYGSYATTPPLPSLASNILPQLLQPSAPLGLADTFLEHHQKRRAQQAATFRTLAESGPAQRDKATRARLITNPRTLNEKEGAQSLILLGWLLREPSLLVVDNQ